MLIADFCQNGSMKKISTLLAVLLGLSSLHAESVKDREGAVRGDRAKLENDDRWIYDNYQRGFDEAKRTGKPLLVVLRCVPCLACMGIDAQVLLEEKELATLLDQFVCVRLINANALDLALFQFDYDLSFTTLFFNADGTLYGRYGSWTHQKNSQDTATSGFLKAIGAALDIHKGYPANKAALAPKQGAPTPFKRSIDIPALAEKYKPQLDWEGKVVQSCVHCHMIGAAYQTWHRQQRKPLPEDLRHPWPEPETLGLTLASDHIARVTEVAAASPAAKSGLQPGDDLITLGGQPLISIADISWALHRTPSSANIPLEVKRNGAVLPIPLTLPEGWRLKSDVTRRASIWPMRGMALGGLRIEDLSDEARKEKNLPPDTLALLVTNVGQYGMHGAAKKAGFQKGDIITELDGLTQRMGEAPVLDHLLQKRFPGDQVSVSILRNQERKEFKLPMQ